MRMKKLAVMALAAALSVGTVMTASAAWIQEGSNWRYQNDNGTYQAGTWFRDVDGRWYHFDNNGLMQKGWFLDADGKWYFLAYNGVMQVGLLKVDNQVYYMNPSGDLFLGDMAINGTTYNFGLYGTTNGQPFVPSTATYGGNGNQSLPSGGSGGSTKKDYNSPAVEEAIKDVANTAESIKDDYTTVEDVKVVDKGNNKVSVNVVAAEKLDLEDENQRADLASAIQDAFDTVMTHVDDNKAVVVYNGRNITLSGDKDISIYLTQTNLVNNKGNSVDVKVNIDGEEVVYTITLSK